MDKNYIDHHWIYDIETYPSIFTFTIVRADGEYLRQYEISTRKSDQQAFAACLRYMIKNKQKMVGFNNIGFDYPVLHEIMQMLIQSKGAPCEIKAKQIYRIAQDQIASFKSGFGKTIKTEDCLIKQIDLFKIHHFDNKAKSTSLKMLEFNMRSNNIEDLPFPVGKNLTHSEMDELLAYNKHDVMETLKFYRESLGAIRFREKLSEQYGIDFTNFNDTKIGKEYFIMRLEESMPGVCYSHTPRGRKINQTKRKFIRIKDCLFDYYDFTLPEFKAVKQWFANQIISETKGVFSDIDESKLGDVSKYAEMIVKRKKFKGTPTQQDIDYFKNEHPLGWVEVEELKALETLLDSNGEPVYEISIDAKGKENKKKVKVPKKSYWGCWKEASTLNVVVDGFRCDFGVGGIHGSLSNKIVEAEEGYLIIDADVSSMYPNIAISNRVYPQHLSEKFCDIYEDVYNQRKSFPKGSAENAVMKLALNGVYGDSNNEFSPFYDPQYTMTITINGQLSLCLFVDYMKQAIPDVEIIQLNTDGCTVKIKEADKTKYDCVCEKWQKQVKLQLEYADYKAMYIRDVNNYIALYTNGKVKRKGAYQYEGLGWHQNQSALVIPKAAEAQMLCGISIEEFIDNHMKNPDNKWDFLLRTKVPRSSRLVMILDDGTEVPLQNICRYYPSQQGGKLIKFMPALEGKEDQGERALGLETSYKVLPCNNIEDFSFNKIDLSYYYNEARKLLVGVDNIEELLDNTNIHDSEIANEEGEDYATT